MNWQPIETAPKDGTDVLVWGPGCKSIVASWNPAETRWSDGFWDDGLTDDPWIHATHWMPLPAGPAKEPQ